MLASDILAKPSTSMHVRNPTCGQTQEYGRYMAWAEAKKRKSHHVIFYEKKCFGDGWSSLSSEITTPTRFNPMYTGWVR
jgi:hypothetical protein